MRNLLVWLPLLMLCPGLAFGQKVDPAQASPKAVVQATFKALYDSDFDRIIALTDPKSKEAYSKFLMELFEGNPQDPMVVQLKEQLRPIDTKEEVSQAGPDGVLKQKYENTYRGITKEQLRKSSPELDILGVIVESAECAHVITRSVSLHVIEETCHKSNGKWYMVLDEGLPRLWRRSKAIHEKHIPDIEDIVSEFQSAKVLGYVPDGNDHVHALCRVQVKVAGITFEDLILHPVYKGELAWDHLDDKDQTELIAALRERWGI
ncbi:hypothetical protein C5Y96_01180 [Blastopirellula marina]|uniref:Uncharacterized protein n=1 Tax=Blastopirellula marina TaxID=124 RepID=A0A2S8G8N2_9BACT|nr:MULTISPECIES: hypothetical protein [Pirellulaceae]PQO40815.1 hypothetical protein C5Y96_01180 [Blastopirellula marina]RCS56142.1 hypothetical protein DTL36_01180 [Bremerella cremea]